MSAIKQPSSSLTPFQIQCVGWIRGIVVARPSLVWLTPSRVLATIRIESGFDPNIKAADFARTGSVGLMQVTTATLVFIQQAYGLDSSMPQTDPQTSILTGMCCLEYGARYLVNNWHIHTIPLSAIEEAFNEGWGAAAAGRMVPIYWMNWLFAQQGYNYVDEMP